MPSDPSTASSLNSPAADRRRLRLSLLDPDIGRHLLTAEGELVVDEVTKHWVTRVVPSVVAILGVLIMMTGPGMGRFWWVSVVVGLGVSLWGLERHHEVWMDRFVITNMRVFRVHGIFSRHVATMPLARILDISLHQSFVGQVLNFGHFQFESAAQDQGLRDIRFVPYPVQRDLTIQRVIQLAGIRAVARAEPSTDDGT